MVRRIFQLSDRTVSSLMTPRHEIVWLDRTGAPDEARRRMADKAFSRYPVADGDLDHVAGYVDVKDLMAQTLTGVPFDPFSTLYQPVYVPETMSALELLERLKEEHAHMALVFDEYGGLEGLVTSTDLLEAIVGNIDLPFAPLIVAREDNSWLVDGTLPFVDLLELLEIDAPARMRDGSYQTVGGFMLSMLKDVPEEGESVDWEGYRFEVVDMDGFRVDKVLVAPITAVPPER